MGGVFPSPEAQTSSIAFFTIATLGNSQDFGNLTANRQHAAGLGDTIRGVCAGGVGPGGSGSINTIDYINIATQ